MTRALIPALLLSATIGAGCQVLCGGPVAEYCADHPCPGTWTEAMQVATTDTGGDAFDCETEDMLLAHGYMMGRNLVYDKVTEELVTVQEWSDIEEYCGDTSFTRTWGEEYSCKRACTHEPELADARIPLCDEAAAR